MTAAPSHDPKLSPTWLGQIFDSTVIRLPRTPTSNADAARTLAEAGFSIFPASFDKRPQPGFRWPELSTCDAIQIAQWWDRYPDALPAIDTEKSGLVVLDLDRHGDGPDGVAAGETLLGDLTALDAPITLTRNDGAHIFFKAPPGEPIGNSTGALPPGIDVRSRGYVIAPGATLPDGTGWRSDPEAPDLAEAFAAGAIPELPDTILRLIRQRPERPEPPRAPVADPPRPSPAAGERERAFASAALEASAAELAGLGAGQRNEALNAVAFRMGRQIGAGRIGRAEVERVLEAACEANGLARDDGWQGVRATIRSGIDAGAMQPAEPLADRDGWGAQDAAMIAMGAETARALIERADGTLYDAATGEIVEGARPPDDLRRQGELPEHLHHPPGLIGMIADHYERCAFYPIRTLAIAAAISVVGSVMGRCWIGPTNSGTNLYVAVVAATGTGKEMVFQVPKTVLRQAGLQSIVGPGDLMSQTALSNLVVRKPLCIALIDEIQILMKRTHGKRASSYEQGITKTMRELWGVNTSEWSSAAWAGKDSETVFAPSLTILGAGPPKEFWESFTGDSLENGFLNRFVVFTAQETDYREPALSISDPVPQEIIDALQAIFDGGRKGDLGGSQTVLNPFYAPRHAKIGWEDDHAQAAYMRFQSDLKALRQADPDITPYIARSAEMAIRIAAICAIGRRQTKPSVSVEDFRWARGVVEHSVATMRAGVGFYLAENEAQANANRVLRIIRDKGGRCTRRDVTQNLKHVFKPREVDDVFRALTDSGAVEVEIVEPPEGRGGHKTTFFRLARGWR